MGTVEAFSFADIVIPRKFYERIYKGNKEITEIFKERLNEKRGMFYGDFNGAGISMAFYFKPKTENQISCSDGKVLETIDYENVERIDMALNGNREQIISAQEKLDEILEETLNHYYPHTWRKK